MGYKFKKHLQSLERRRAGTHDLPQDSLYLNRNERVVPFDQATLQQLMQRISKLNIHFYPDLEKFYKRDIYPES